MLFRNNNKFKNVSNYSNSKFSLVKELQNAVNGKDGEVSAIFTYLFQHIISKDEKISEAMLKMAQDEMEHMEALSHLNYSLGTMPYFVDASNNFFTTRYVNYETNPNNFLSQDLEGEKIAIKEYLHIIENTDDEKAKSILKEIVEDEKEHVEILKRLLESVGENKI